MEQFTRIPNIILDEWMSKMQPSSFKVLMAICRKIYGWRKKSDYISLSQIKKSTGLDKRTIIRSIQELEEKNLIIVDKNSNINQYTLNETSDILTPVGNETSDINTPTSDKNDTKLVTNCHIQKKDKEKTKETSEHHNLIKHFTTKYKELTGNDMTWFPRYNKEIQRILLLANEKEIYKRLKILEEFFKTNKGNFWSYTPDKFYSQWNNLVEKKEPPSAPTCVHVSKLDHNK